MAAWGAPKPDKTERKDERVVLKGLRCDVPVFLTEHNRARRISLRVDPVGGRVVLVKPRRVSKRDAIAFAAEKTEWIADRLAELPQPIPFEPDAGIPLFGRPHTLRHRPEARRGVWLEEDNLCVSGPREHLSRRTQDWLKREARHVTTPIAKAFAEQLGKHVSQVSIRDTKSRWGSCTATGKLSFSWRLILTPEHVLRYVVAHEVAHLKELNHSSRFWQVVETLIDDRQAATQWLKTHGGELHRYGLSRPEEN